MRFSVYLLIVAGLALAIIVGCATPSPTAAPAKPTPAVTAAPAAVTNAPAVATKPPAAAAPGVVSQSATAPTSVPAPKVKRGGTLRAANSWTYPTLDPHLSQMMRLDGYYLLYNMLLRYDLIDEATGKFELKPELAESYQRTNDTTFEFKIRKGVKFHDGSDVTPEVIAWNFNRMKTHPKSYSKSQIEGVKSVEAIDDRTVRFNLKGPFPALPVSLSRGLGADTSIVSKTALETLGDDAFNRRPVGSGPMSIEEWRQDDQVVLKKFPGYWENGVDGQPIPYLDRYSERFITDPAVILLEMKSGNIDYTENIEAKDVASVKSNSSLVYHELPYAGPVYFVVGFNFRKNNNFSDKRIRQAALMSYDRQAMANAMGFGLAKPHYYIYWQQGILGYDESVPYYKYDPEKAKALLKEAGYPNGIDVRLSTIARQPEQRIGEMAQQMWTQSGLRTSLDALERLANSSKMQAGDFESSFWRDSTIVVDPDFSTRQFQKDGASNSIGYDNPNWDKCMEEGRSTYDEAKRKQIYMRCQTIIYEDATAGAGYRIPENKVYNKAVKGLTFQFIFGDMRRVWLDK